IQDDAQRPARMRFRMLPCMRGRLQTYNSGATRPLAPMASRLAQHRTLSQDQLETRYIAAMREPALSRHASHPPHKNLLAKLAFLFLAIVLGIVLICIVYCLLDIRRFEWAPLYGLLGAKGIAFVAFQFAALCAAFALCVSPSLRFWLSSTRKHRLVAGGAAALWCLSNLWLADWVFLETPLTVRAANRLNAGATDPAIRSLVVRHYESDGSLPALM